MIARTFRAFACVVTVAAVLPLDLAAQTRTPAPATPSAPAVIPSTIDENARETRDKLRQLLDQYPPSLAQVLRLDPSLVSRSDYVAPYPRLAAFLSQHPEVAHNPVFFLGDARFNVPDARGRTFDMLEGILAGMAGLTVFATIVGLIVWVVRSLISYRSWKHIVKIQTEAHTKIFDRLGSNDDLMVYIQSPAGQRFLTSTSTAVEVAPRSVGAPIGRILWSVQAGTVITIAGIGLFVASGLVIEEVAQVLHVISVLAIAIGLGFVASALVAYALSHRLGLLESPRT